jgi:AhpC/TSA family
VLFCRGAWSPCCNAPLRGFERAGQAPAEAGVRVGALSVDDLETTAALVAYQQLTFPVGYGADAAAIAARTGAFVNPEPGYLLSTGFVLASKACQTPLAPRKPAEGSRANGPASSSEAGERPAGQASTVSMLIRHSPSSPAAVRMAR